MNRLGYGAFYTCTDVTGFFEVGGLLPLACLLLSFIKRLRGNDGQCAPFLVIISAQGERGTCRTIHMTKLDFHHRTLRAGVRQ